MGQALCTAFLTRNSLRLRILRVTPVDRGFCARNMRYPIDSKDFEGEGEGVPVRRK
jgi:hypothetical protein